MINITKCFGGHIVLLACCLLVGCATDPWLAVERGQSVSEIQALLDAGGNPNSGNLWGQTALLNAVSRCRLDVVELLISRGADVNRKGLGPSALEKALVRNGCSRETRRKMAKLLLDAGFKTPSDVAIVIVPRDVTLYEKGKSMGGWFVDRKTIELQPGLHNIQVGFFSSGNFLFIPGGYVHLWSTENIPISFHADKGGVYAIDYTISHESKTWRAWIEKYK